jgi:hypothetical protein
MNLEILNRSARYRQIRRLCFRPQLYIRVRIEKLRRSALLISIESYILAIGASIYLLSEYSVLMRSTTISHRIASSLGTSCNSVKLINIPPQHSMTPQQLEDRQLEIRATALEAELSQMKKLLSSLPQIETVNPNWIKYAGVFKDDVDFLAIMQKIHAERDSDDESEVDPSYYSYIY